MRMPISGVDLFLEELESHCYSIAIATFLNSDGQSWAINLKRQGFRVIYGDYSDIKDLFIAQLLAGSNPSGSLVLRSFTSEIDELTQLPIKELRGYSLKCDGNKLEYEKLPPNAMFACHNTDAASGEPLPLEQAIRYC